jgi:hypothetical protein
LAVSDWQSVSWLQRRIVPLNVQPFAGGESLQVAAQEAENAFAAHCGAGSFLLSGANVTSAQQIGADAGQSEAVVHAREALVAHVAAQAFVWAERFAQQI